ncbi:MAG: acyltransferase [Lachnospiraceae bacterium]|nr:acyltransferase [Lachnospiraceae bacterium]
MKKRIAYLDVARGIGMILVVMGHVDFISEPLRDYITSFHMPLFLIVSGILLYVTKTEERSFGQVAKRKCCTILLPYFVFSGGAILFELVRALVKDLDMTGELLRRCFQTLCLQGFSTFWFLPTLFIGELIFLKVRQKWNLKWTAGIGIGLTILMYFVAIGEKSFYQSHAGVLGYELLHDVLLVPIRGAFSGGYIFLGYFLGILLEKRPSVLWRDGPAGIFLLIVTAIINQFASFVDLRFLQFGNPILFFLRTICGAIGVIMLCRGLEAYLNGFVGNVLRFFGKNSLIIMTTHLDYRILNYCIKAAALINGFVRNQVLYAVLTVLFVFLVEAVVIYIINRFFYKILGRKTQK